MAETPQRIGVIGLGAMGRPIARHMLAKGYQVAGHDPNAEAREKAAGLGVDMRDTPAAVARESDLVLVVVAFDAEVEKAMFDRDGIVAAARAGSTVAIGSTIAPSTARRLTERVPAGLNLLDMALARGEPAAEDGTLLILGGGDEATFEACMPVFRTFASDVFNLGPFGAGQVGKMVNNLILWACMSANDEALRLGEALGIDQEKLRAALVRSSAQNWSMSYRADTRPIRWAEKDLNIALNEADALGLSVPLAGLVREMIKAFKHRHGYPTKSLES